jgi:hypothetical protein
MIQRLTTVAQSRSFLGGRQSRRLWDSWRPVTQLMMGTVALADLGAWFARFVEGFRSDCLGKF